ncbi:hypothetical protein IAD21_02195 [Abditibacteriota bacterium]|nr:hypothetical protein IAD21_02195 [Abditibacteriota bacterium]
MLKPLMPQEQTDNSHKTAPSKTGIAFVVVFGLMGALVFGMAVPRWLFPDGRPHVQGSGSEMVGPALIPLTTISAAIVGTIVGSLLGLIVFLVAKFGARHS